MESFWEPIAEHSTQQPLGTLQRESSIIQHMTLDIRSGFPMKHLGIHFHYLSCSGQSQTRSLYSISGVPNNRIAVFHVGIHGCTERYILGIMLTSSLLWLYQFPTNRSNCYRTPEHMQTPKPTHPLFMRCKSIANQQFYQLIC